MVTQLAALLNQFRALSQSEREKGTYFEQLIVSYLKNEPSYQDLYEDVWLYADWAREQGIKTQDAGIDLVAKTRSGEFHAVQCKLYATDYKLHKSDIDSFFTASGKKPFAHRLIVSTTSHWTQHAEDALKDQQPPVTKIDLFALEDSQIDWSKYQPKKAVVLKPKKKLRPHQELALSGVKRGLKNQDRGKLIMACGTGKTFTSLKIAEDLAGKNGRVLFLVPSLSLLSQTLTEWTQESAIPLHSFAVCSDSTVGKKRASNDDVVEILTHELRYPATTDAKSLKREMDRRHEKSHMSVVFSTYHSIEVISQAQKKHGLDDFDLIICDEAHRTTGATMDGDDESAFVKIHDAKFIHGKKRLYMTATPRIYADSAKASAEKDNVAICSMDDESIYGGQLYVLTFSDAVKQQLLVDYKVLVLAVEETHVSRRLQTLLSDDNNQLKVDDAAKIVGCWKALAKQGLTQDLIGDSEAMRRAVAFCQVIEPGTNPKKHKVSSKNIAAMFQSVVEAYQEEEDVDPEARLICEAAHVDGTMNATQKEEKLNWLKEETDEKVCRILSNVRCLSEGVDVPALDAVLFLTPRNSQVEVVQSVGRVMRNAPGKKRGYVILPVVIPAGMEPHEALNDNKTYSVVWQVLQALRSHDDRFDAMVNKLDLIGKDTTKMEIIAITDKIATKQKKTAKDSRTTSKQAGRGSMTVGEAAPTYRPDSEPVAMQFEIGEIEKAIYAKVVQKCGNRHHWEDWANDIAKIANTHIGRIKTILENPKNAKERMAFESFANELRDDLNDSITDDEIIEMLAQHLITKPVFEALFAGYSFAQHNPISLAMQSVMDVLNDHRFDKEVDTLESFYSEVRGRIEGIQNPSAKQKIVIQLYDNFFRNAFPKMSKRFGIVYTPVDVVDFIIHSVNDILRTEFDESLGAKGVHIIDPFTGTGTFITRLLQSGLIKPGEVEHKYKNEIHANEIVLLAYYIAAINIEAVYHSIVGGTYAPFEGICLTDTFQLYEKEDLFGQVLIDNSERRRRQKQLEIKVIFGNPPYSIGQGSQNDNNQNVSYARLDKRIADTYAKKSSATLFKGLYDSYVRAIRWASDRIGDSGVIGFVINSGFIEKPAMDGIRKDMVDEFSSLFIVNLRGDIRKNMFSQGRAKEGQNIFGSKSMNGVAIVFLVKNPTSKVKGKIFYHDIGDDLGGQEKLQKLIDFKSVSGVLSSDQGWKVISPDEYGDWLKQRAGGFDQFVKLGDKGGDEVKLFERYSLGVSTNRDAWCFNSSREELARNIERMITYYNQEVDRFSEVYGGLDRKQAEPLVDDFIITDSTKISWSRGLKHHLVMGRKFAFDSSCIVQSLYRPFEKRWLYFNKHLNEMVLQMPRMFPNALAKNLVICVSGVGARSEFSALISNVMPCLDTIEKGQCFPLYLYFETKGDSEPSLLVQPSPEAGDFGDGLTEEGLLHFKSWYPDVSLNKEDVFYYVYGLLHSTDYRDRYADNLRRELPRIPRVASVQAFLAFSKAGRALAKLHLDYEHVTPYPLAIESSIRSKLPDSAYRVEKKMRYGKTKVSGKNVDDKTTLIYNDHITLKGIPLKAYDYIVNGKPALDWVVERQCVKTDKVSGIVNDANAWAIETMGNPKYPLELFQRVVTVSLETMKIVEGLPPLDIMHS